MQTASSIIISIVHDNRRYDKRFDQEQVRVGRGVDNDLVFAHEAELSTQHVQLIIQDAVLVVKYLDPKNGVFLNGQRVQADTPISEKDELRLGPNGPQLHCKIIAADASTMLAADQAVSLGGQESAVETATKPRSFAAKSALIIVLLVTACVSYYNARYGHSQKHEESKGSTPITKSNSRPNVQANDDEPDLATSHAEQLELQKPLMLELKILFKRLEDQGRIIESLEKSVKEGAGNKEKNLALMRRAEKRIAELSQLISANPPHVHEDKIKQAEQQWARLYQQYKSGLFLVVAINPQTETVGIGTAFAIDDKGTLATNAHVVQLLRSMPKRLLIQNETGAVYKIKRAAHNPLFVTLSSPDVGIIEMDLQGAAVSWAGLPLANDEELYALEVGGELGTIGFPGELQKQYLNHDAADVGLAVGDAKQYKGAVATFKHGWLGRVSDYEGQSGDQKKNVLIQHSASLSGGTSGSPIFASNGKVIAVASSSMTSSFQVGSLRTRELLSAAQIAFAVRVDELRAFVSKARLQTLP